MKNLKLLRAAYEAWNAAADLRSRRERHKRYTYGDQWCDMVNDGNGNLMREEALIASTGKKPLTNNLIRQLVKNIVGRYRTMASEAALYDLRPGSAALLNRLPELDCRMLEDFVISGCAVQRVVAERRPAGEGVWVDNVEPARFFVNDFRDPRGWDITLVGMLHDMSFAELANRFADGTAEGMERMRRLFESSTGSRAFAPLKALGMDSGCATDFFAAPRDKCRVAEVWRYEADERLLCHDPENGEAFATDPSRRAAIEAENALRAEQGRRPVSHRLEMDMTWRCTWLAHDGTVLARYDSPYGHRAHPFVVKFYPMTDGEVHSFVEDVIDQQRTINRLVVLIDHMLSSSAKGVLLYPVTQLPEGMSIENVCDLWAQPDAVIPTSGRAGEQPRQIITNTANSGAYNLLSLQMQLFERVSGIGDALLGRNVSAATGSTLYADQVRNASMGLTDLLETFASFTADRDAKISKCIPGA